ncbi:hypothetical protein [Pseudomonas sp. L5B5]|uniref:hypothetical protein n=1 Tax=Pseudomonas sp. L5B5 TaxID=2883205 RepID=UPI001CFBA354|nr:hypothetical protein [Pseudomonas sp. L5B5]UCZ84123.1 hypothetical protein LGQ10_27985 [Pseudomonas sp. L5B5]
MTFSAVQPSPHAPVKAPQQLLYLVYGGNAVYRREVKFSILTALSHLKGNEQLCIRIMTDRPQDYDGWPVETVVLDEQTLHQWQGQNGYPHRRKACAIASGLKLAEKTLFVDTDTLFLKSPMLLLKQIRPQHYLMDCFEYHWRDVSSRQVYQKLGQCLKPHGIEPDSDFRLYNSGLCGLTDSDASMLETAIEMIDEWTRDSYDIHTIEQVALSFTMRGKPVQEARKHVYHYFAAKRFFHAMQAHFFSLHGEAYRPELIALCQEMPRQKPLPHLWQRLRIKWQLRRLKGGQKKIGRDVLYGSSLPDTPYHSACKHAWWECASREIGRWDEQQQQPLLTLEDGTWPEHLPRPNCPEDRRAILNYLRQPIA